MDPVAQSWADQCDAVTPKPTAEAKSESQGAGDVSNHHGQEVDPSATSSDSPNEIASLAGLPPTEPAAPQLPPGHVEEKFRVDRRKLECMIVAEGRLSYGHAETSERFFSSIMQTTNTVIDWPSKLKIGAKSKKDPHVKIRGLQADAERAKMLVLAKLDTKSSRITVKMEVAHTDHSHIIGKGGANIKRVMNETGCHIHFPDCNSAADRRAQQEKSNQVTVSGQPDAVEIACHQIHQLLPVCLGFPVPDAQAATPYRAHWFQTSSDTISLASRHGVQVQFTVQPRNTVPSIQCEVRSSQANIASLVTVVKELREKFCHPVHQLPVETQLDIAPQHHLFMIGRNGNNIRRIMERTGATITFPEQTQNLQRRSLVTVSGSVDAVVSVRDILLGRLPLTLMFDVKSDEHSARLTADSDAIGRLMESNDVLISIKPMQPKQRVIIKGMECNAKNVYKTRRCLVDSTYMASQSSAKSPSPRDHEFKVTADDDEWPALTGTMNISALSVDNLQQIPSADQDEPKPSGVARIRRGSLPNVSWTELRSSSNVRHTASGRLASSAIASLRYDAATTGLLPPMQAVSEVAPVPAPEECVQSVPDASTAIATTATYTDVAASAAGIGMPSFDTAQGCQPTAASPCPLSQDAENGSAKDQQPVWDSDIGRAVSTSPAMSEYSSTSSASASGTAGSDDVDECDWLRPLLSAASATVSANQLSPLLLQIGIDEKYCSLLCNEEVDMATFSQMTAEDLKQIGIKPFGPRKKLVVAIRELQRILAPVKDQQTRSSDGSNDSLESGECATSPPQAPGQARIIQQGLRPPTGTDDVVNRYSLSPGRSRPDNW